MTADTTYTGHRHDDTGTDPMWTPPTDASLAIDDSDTYVLHSIQVPYITPRWADHDGMRQVIRAAIIQALAPLEIEHPDLIIVVNGLG